MSLNQWGRYQGTLGGKVFGTAFGPYGYGSTCNHQSTNVSSVWPTADLAIFVPVVLEGPTVIAQLYCVNGTVVAGNVDVGIYSVDGTRLASAGSTAQAGTSASQRFNITDIRLDAGLYYMALALSDAATATINGMTLASAELGRVVGFAQMATAFPLPAVATFASYTKLVVPTFGFLGAAV